MSSEPTVNLRALLEAKLDTFEKVELVLALHAAGGALTVGELALQLQVGRDALRRVASDVSSSGVVEMIDGDAVRLQAASCEVEILEVARLYANDRRTLIRILTSIAREQLRSLAARTFADAFLIRRKRKPRE